MEITITLADMFLGVWAIVATVGYYLEKHKGQEFKFRTAVIMRALAEGDAKFVHDKDGYSIEASKGE